MSRPANPLLRIAAATAISLLTVACSTTGGGAISAGPTASARPAPSFAPRPTVAPTASPVTGEVPPDVIEAVRAELGAFTGTDASNATVVKAEAVEWPDGSLGCPQRGVMYVQVVTPGYQVVLEQTGRDYDYRVAGEGAVIRLCEGVLPGASG